MAAAKNVHALRTDAAGPCNVLGAAGQSFQSDGNLEDGNLEEQLRAALAQARPAYEISVLDNQQQTVVARFAMEASDARHGGSVADGANRLARRLVAALERESLLFERR